MLRIVHEKHEKNIRCRFLADDVIPGIHSQLWLDGVCNPVRNVWRMKIWQSLSKTVGAGVQPPPRSATPAPFGV